MASSASPASLVPGSVVAGRYRVLGALGAGGMGTVYRAVQEPLGREVALKVISPALASDANVVERFRREAKAASSLSHPHIVTVFDFGNDGGTLFIAMELLVGEGLDDVVRRGPMPVARALPILRGISAALAEAHARGIIHRDLKPQNVMLTSTSTQQDVVKVVDFGIARMAEGGGRTLTQTGVVVGTPGYVAPETFDGASPSPSSDLYALGVLAYELLCGTPPFPGVTPREILKAVLFGEPLPLRNFARDVPERLEALVLSLLARDPTKRPASAKDVDQALAAIPTTSLPSLPPLPPLPPSSVPSPSTRVIAGPGGDTPATAAMFLTESMGPSLPVERPPETGVVVWGPFGHLPAVAPATPSPETRPPPLPPPATPGAPLVPPPPPRSPAPSSSSGVPAWVIAVGVVLGGSALMVPLMVKGTAAPEVLEPVQRAAVARANAEAVAASEVEARSAVPRSGAALEMPQSARDTLFTNAGEAMRNHLPQAAETILLTLLDHRPDDVEALLMLSNVYAQTGRPREARIIRQEVLERAPDHPKAPLVRQFLDQRLDAITLK